VRSVVSQNLRKFRRDQTLTLRELASRSGIKLSTLSAIEQGRIRNPSFKRLAAVAKALQVPRDLLLEDPQDTPLLHQGDLKGEVQLEYKKDGLRLISYTPLMRDLFIGKGVLRPKRTLNFQHFPRLTYVFIEVIFGKLEFLWENQTGLISEGKNLSLRSPQRKNLRNPFQMKETSFLIVTRPSLVSAGLESQSIAV